MVLTRVYCYVCSSSQAEELLRQNRFYALPIIGEDAKEGQVLGVITQAEIAKAFRVRSALQAALREDDGTKDAINPAYELLVLGIAS